MDCIELIDILDKGEDSKHQFKENFNSIDNLAVEISAFANSTGGILIIGASDNGDLSGLSQDDIKRLNQWISNATSTKIEPVIFVETETLKCNDKKLLIVNVPRGNNKPYAVNKTEFWVKNGADKRRATREELFRLMQSSNILYADELDTRATFEKFDIEVFRNYYEKYYKEKLPELDIPVYKLLENLRLMSGNKLTLAGLLLFGKEVETVKPQFSIKATCFEGNDVSVNKYIDKEDITGKLIDLYKHSINFVKRNLRRIQTGDNFNIPSKIEIPEEAFSEAIANAIIHRDYFINSSIFVNIFYDRLEVISPGTLPNTITEENIKYGVHIERNPTIISFLEKDTDFDYTGRGSGIPRIIRLCKNERIDYNFINEASTQRFKVVFRRPELKKEI